MPATCNTPDMPPVTDDHRRRAHFLLAMRDNFEQAMADPWRARVIECCATTLRTDDWLMTQRRSVVPVRRCRPGVDGHPVKWATQMAMGPWVPVTQPDLLDQH